jgi:hypothetical protein
MTETTKIYAEQPDQRITQAQQQLLKALETVSPL